MSFDSHLLVFIIVVAVLLLNHDLLTGNRSLPAPGTRGKAAARGTHALVMPGRACAADERVVRVLEDISLSDSSFEPEHFLEGARIVYETAIVAFAKGDRALLREVSSSDVFDTFSEAIAAREAARESVELRIVRLKESAIVDAWLFNKVVQITASFTTEMIRSTRNATGAVVAGDPAAIISTADHWTFEKSLGSAGWKLVATAPAEEKQI
jgi:predicted lipid-binding transport protein (Tim44 family)